MSVVLSHNHRVLFSMTYGSFAVTGSVGYEAVLRDAQAAAISKKGAAYAHEANALLCQLFTLNTTFLAESATLSPKPKSFPLKHDNQLIDNCMKKL